KSSCTNSATPLRGSRPWRISWTFLSPTPSPATQRDALVVPRHPARAWTNGRARRVLTGPVMSGPRDRISTVNTSSHLGALELLDAPVAGMGGERREGQHELASAVADAIERGHHLVAEAPTGSGKSLAYLAPAVASGKKVVIATSTIALQSQLVGKDLPALA